MRHKIITAVRKKIAKAWEQRKELGKIIAILCLLVVLGGLAFLYWQQRKVLADAFYRLAPLYSAENRHQEAIDALNQAMRLYKQPLGYKLLGQEYFFMDDDVRAESMLAAAKKENPQDAETLYFLADIHMFQNKRGEAESELKQAIALSPGSGFYYDLLGLLYLQDERFGEAEKIFAAGIAQNPENANLYNGLGTAYFKQGKLDVAEEQYLKALELDSDHENAQRNLELVRTAKS